MSKDQRDNKLSTYPTAFSLEPMKAFLPVSLFPIKMRIQALRTFDNFTAALHNELHGNPQDIK